MDSDQEVEEEADELPGLNGLPDATAASPSRRLDQAPMPPPQDATSVLPSVSTTKSDVLGTPLRHDKKRNTTAALTGTPSTLGLPSMSPPLTPLVTRVLARARCPTASTAPRGPDDRFSQKQVGWEEKRQKMEALTEPWRPYRSIGVYYMWALAEEKATS